MKGPTLIRWLLGLILIAAFRPQISSAQSQKPWETPQGRACMDRWAAETANKLNAYQGNQEHNGRKPWNFHPRYGTIQGNPQVGPTSVAAPDNFRDYGNNKYWYMYANWIPVGPLGTWRYPEWNAASIESIQSYVAKCVGAMGITGGPSAGGNGGAPGGGAGSGTGAGSGGGASMANVIVADAVDSDQENKLWDCATRRVPFGDKKVDVLRCMSFRYQIPSEGISSATLHVAVEPLGADQDTDSTVVAVGQPFPNCASVQGQMSGCVTVHGGFKGGEPSLDLDLFNLTCDPSAASFVSPEAQQAVIAQLQTGVLHAMLQDDTAVFRAQLILNGGPLTVPCGTSNRPGTPGTGTGVTDAGGSTGPTASQPPPAGSTEPARTTRMTLQAGRRRVTSGALVDVPVWLINGTDVANVNFTVAYDGSVARPEGDLGKGNLLENTLFSSNTADAGLIRVGFAGQSGLSGTGTVAYIPFRAVGQPGRRTTLHLQVTTINDPGGATLAIDRIDGAIEIVGPTGQTVGDCNGDGKLNEVDALCALRMSVNLMPANNVLDMDQSNDVTSRDAAIILQRARTRQ